MHEICQLIKEGFSSAQIRDKGYPYTLVRSIKIKNNWAHISDLYFKRSSTIESTQ